MRTAKSNGSKERMMRSSESGRLLILSTLVIMFRMASLVILARLKPMKSVKWVGIELRGDGVVRNEKRDGDYFEFGVEDLLSQYIFVGW